MAHYLSVPLRSRRATITPLSASISRGELEHLQRLSAGRLSVSSFAEQLQQEEDGQENDSDINESDQEESKVSYRWKRLAKKARGLGAPATAPAPGKKSSKLNVIINLNIGGVKFRTTLKTLRSVPYTRLALLTKKSKNYNEEKDEFFYDRNPEMFNWILDYYRTGEMHIPRHFCARSVEQELIFWGLNEQCFSNCCKKYFIDTLDEIATYEILLQDFQELPKKLYGVDSAESHRLDSCDGGGLNFRQKVWVFLDDPSSSLPAKIWAFIYLVMVLMTVLSLFLASMPVCRVNASGGMFHRHVKEYRLSNVINSNNNDQSLQNVTSSSNSSGPITHPLLNSVHLQHAALNNTKLKILLTTQPHDVLLYIDFICMLFFTIEFIIRFVVCPKRLRLLKNIWTFLDLMYLMPVWILFIIDVIDSEFWHDPNRISGLLTMQALMVFRVFRMFRFVRHYRGLKLLWLALRASVGELFLLFVFVMFAVTIYASIIYCAEIFNENSYESIFIGAWWALITMTTVGYGDVSPETWAGYIVACFCAFTGIIIIGMPVPIIASNFHAYYGLRIPEEVQPELKPKRVKPIPKPKASHRKR